MPDLLFVTAVLRQARDLVADHPGKFAELRRLLREFGSWQKPGVGPYTQGRDGFKPPKDWIVRE